MMTMTASKEKTGKETGKRGKTPGSAAHYFPPGQSGNPDGRPKGALNYKTIAMQVWAEVSAEQATAYNKKYAKSIKAGQRKPKSADDFPIPQLLIKKHTIMALSGDRQSLDSVQDRFFGKAAQPIIGDPENPIEHNVEIRKERVRRILGDYGVPVMPVKKITKAKKVKQEKVEPVKIEKEKPQPKALPVVPPKMNMPHRKKVSRRPIDLRFKKNN